MKILVQTLVVALGFLVAAPSFAAGPTCSDLMLSSGAWQKETSWRKARTNSSTVSVSVVQAETSRKRENQLMMLETALMKEIWGPAPDQGDVPSLELVAEDGVSVKMVQKAEYMTGRYGIHSVSGLKRDANQKLRVTLALPVSGHVGRDNAVLWSTTDTYTIFTHDRFGQYVELASDMPSRDFITFQEVEVPLIPNREVKIYYLRTGNTIDGFMEGRTVGFVWDGTYSK